MYSDYNDGMGDAQQFLSNNDEFYGLYLHKAKELSMLQAEHLKWLNKYDALQKKYLALVEEDTKLTQELTASLKKQCELMATTEKLRNSILNRTADAMENVPLLVTIGALGVLVIKFSIEFFVWLAQ